MDDLNESLKAFFSTTTKLHDQWIEYKRSVLRSVKKIRNHTEQFRLVESHSLRFPNELEVMDLGKKLIAKIAMNIEIEMEDLERVRCAMEEDVYKVDRLKSKVDKIAETLSVESLPERPVPYSLLFQLKQSIFTFFHASFVKINAGCKTLNYRDDETLMMLEKVADEDDVPPESLKMLMWFANKFVEDIK